MSATEPIASQDCSAVLGVKSERSSSRSDAVALLMPGGAVQTLGIGAGAGGEMVLGVDRRSVPVSKESDYAMDDRERRSGALQLEPGMIYEDCFFHPCLCTKVDMEDGEVNGISLIDGTAPRGCDLYHCDPVVLTVEDVLVIRADFAGYVARRTAEYEAMDRPAD